MNTHGSFCRRVTMSPVLKSTTFVSLDRWWHHSPNAGRRTKFAPGKSLRFFELFLELSLFEFRFTVFFTLGCGVDSWILNLQFFQTVEGKAPKEAWGSRLSGGGINVAFLRLHEPQLSAMRCVALNQIDQAMWFASDLLWFSVHITPPCPRLFISALTRFLKKGEFSNRLRWLVL